MTNKIDIFINTGIFNSSLFGAPRPPRGILHTDDQLDIFKYVLSSLQPWLPLVNKVYINVELEPYFEPRRNELQNYAEKLFGGKLQYRNSRNLTQQQWQQACEEIKSDTLLFLCNHDHFFIDSSLDVLTLCLDVLEKEKNPYKSIYFSHLPEMLANIHAGGTTNELHHFPIGSDSIQIISKETLKYWWFNTIYNRTFRRTDEHGYHVNDTPNNICYIPPKEIGVHYEGYWIPGEYPAHVIPPGFFENNIKIRYGYEDKKDDWVNINPSAENYAETDPNGTDYKWVLEDIPLFWKDKISEIDSNPNNDNWKLLNDRNKALIRRLKARTWCLANWNKGVQVKMLKNTIEVEEKIENYIKQNDPLFNRCKEL